MHDWYVARIAGRILVAILIVAIFIWLLISFRNVLESPQRVETATPHLVPSPTPSDGATPRVLVPPTPHGQNLLTIAYLLSFCMLIGLAMSGFGAWLHRH